MTREQVKEEVKKLILPLCFNEAAMDWDVVADMKLLVDVIKEIISEDDELRTRITEGAGELHSIDVSWTCGGGRPHVSIYYKVKPEVREVNPEELDVFVYKCKKNDYDFVHMGVSDIAPTPEQVFKLVKARYYELEFSEIVYADGQVLARHLKDASRKLYYRNTRVYKELYHEAMFGKDGVITKMM